MEKRCSPAEIRTLILHVRYGIQRTIRRFYDNKMLWLYACCQLIMSEEPATSCYQILLYRIKQKRSTEGCSKLKRPETRQVQERLVSTIEHM